MAHTGRRWMGSAMGLAIMASSAATPHAAGAEHQRSHDPFAPTVTRKESAVLKQAVETAATNTTHALGLLTSLDRVNASPAVDFAIGNLYFQDQHLDEAADAYQAALKKLPKFRGALMNLGRVYLMQERTQDAIELYQQLVMDGQADADILLLLGHALLMENAPVSAESAYRQSLLLRPKHAEATLGLAKAVMRQERYAEGLALVRELLDRDPTRQDLWSLRVNAHLFLGTPDDAIKAIEKARRLGCADSEMLAIQGDLLLNKDQPEDALRAYEIAFRGNAPSVPRMLRAIEGFLLVGDTESAEALLARVDAIRQDPSEGLGDARETTLMRLQADLARQTQRNADAMERCRAILRLDPLDARTMLMLAELQQDAGQLEDAVMTCERAARIQGYEAAALVRQAQIEVQRERYGRAAALLEAAQAFENQPQVGRYLEQVRRMEARWPN